MVEPEDHKRAILNLLALLVPKYEYLRKVSEVVKPGGKVEHDVESAASARVFCVSFCTFVPVNQVKQVPSARTLLEAFASVFVLLY